MSISYYGHSAYDVAQTNRLLQQLRSGLPQQTWAAIALADATLLPPPFGHDIARDFGIEALSVFRFTLIDTDQSHLYQQALTDMAYSLFGEGRLVVTWELDSIVHPPKAL